MESRTAGLTPRDFAIALVNHERNEQQKRFPDESNTPSMWYVILGEEFGEVGRAVLEKEGKLRLEQELTQVAAVAIAWIEDLNR